MRFTGWLCMMQAIIFVPLVVISVFTYFKGFLFIDDIIMIIDLFLIIYILLSFKRLLSEKLQFSNLNNIIIFLIWYSIITASVSVLIDNTPIIYDVVSALIDGIVYILMGTKLLKLQYQFNGLLKPLCYTWVVSGVFVASFLLLPLALITTIIEYILLGLIFFHVADNFPENNPPIIDEESNQI